MIFACSDVKLTQYLILQHEISVMSMALIDICLYNVKFIRVSQKSIPLYNITINGNVIYTKSLIQLQINEYT